MNWFRKLMNRCYGWKYVMYKADFKGNYFYIPVRAYELNTSDGYYIDYWGADVPARI